ncbi:ABC transporter permease [Arthrobacter sp. CAU 1506]|nr:ABC transporter permease [Arthrobacter sp. CAU 1506]
MDRSVLHSGAGPNTTAGSEPAGSARLEQPSAPENRRASAGWALFGSELSVLFRRLRTWAMLLALAAVPVLIAVVVRLAADEGGPGGGPPFLNQITQNGLFVALTGLVVSIPLFLPLTISVVAGDTIAGEAGHGTLRYLLTAPAGRLRLLAVKYGAAVVFCIAAALTIVVTGALIGTILFGTGPVTLLSGDTIGVGDSLVRLLLVAVYVALSLAGLAAIGLFISTLTEVPVGAMATTAVLAVVTQIVGALPQLDWLHPWLFTYHWLDFADLLRQPISWDAFGANALLQGGYIAVFCALAYSRFSTKDVLS